MRFGIMTAVIVSRKIYILNMYRRFRGKYLCIVLVDTEMEAAVCPEPTANI